MTKCSGQQPANYESKRWLALIVVCLSRLMTVLDGTIVNVALPSVRADLGFSEISLAWVVNAYTITFGGFLLLSGRLGDLFGRRRFFLLGIALFTLASLGCGLANSQGLLLAARGAQGLGCALISAVSLALIMNSFPDRSERAKAIGIFSFVSASGGSLGVLLGGVLTSALNWHWIFLVNLPIGVLVYLLGRVLLPEGLMPSRSERLDVAGATTVTSSLMIVVYTLVNGNQLGWYSAQTFAGFAVAALLFILFLGIEARARAPLMPLGLFRMRNLAVGNAAGMLWAVAIFGWFFTTTLYLQVVLGYSPPEVGLAFLPCTVITAVFSLGLSARLVHRLGIRTPLSIGLILAGVGLMFFAYAPVAASVIAGMVLVGLGTGVAFNPLLLASMSDVPPDKTGIASGVVNTTLTMGGALGVAIANTVAGARTRDLLASGESLPVALASGYHVAFFVGAIVVAVGAALCASLLRTAPQASEVTLVASGTQRLTNG